MRGGTSADRQLAVYQETGDLRSVVDRLVAETAEGVRPEIVEKYARRPLTGDRYRATVIGEDTSKQLQGAT
jgi:carboxylate-amine ligase